MKILVLSDTHNKKINLNLKDYDLVIHLGDYLNEYDNLIKHNAYIVKGNCDTLGTKEKIIEVNGKKILLTHGDLFDVKYSLNRLYYYSLEKAIDIVLFGHTHKSTYYKDDKLLMINPGAYLSNEYVEINDICIKYYKNNEVVKLEKMEW